MLIDDKSVIYNKRHIVLNFPSSGASEDFIHCFLNHAVGQNKSLIFFVLYNYGRAAHEQDKKMFSPEASIIIAVIRNYNVELPVAIVILERTLKRNGEKKNISACRQILLFQQHVSTGNVMS